MGVRRAYRERKYAFGQQLVTIRTRAALTQIALAVQLGVNRRSVQNWETGDSYPKAETLQRLITVFLAEGMFTPGQELEEAEQLWEQANQDAPHQLGVFDTALFARLLTERSWAPPQAGPASAVEVRANSPFLGTATFVAPRVDWGEALDVPLLYGREQELAMLGQWVVQERCRVVNVLGMGGIGKSALAVTLMHELSAQFEVVLWRSLRDAPSCEALLEDCLQVLAPQPLRELPPSLEGRLSLLLAHLRDQRALLVLDNLESLLSEGESRGRLRPGYEGYGQLMRLVGETAHQSCLLLTSREKPADLERLEGSRRPVRALRLAGLPIDAGERLLAEKEVTGRAHDWARLVELYAGNPLALNIVAQTIVELFEGEIAPFLHQGEIIFGGVRELLDEQFARLSTSEQTVLLWLAILREPVSLEELQAVLVTPLTRTQLLEAAESLRRRSLLERGKRQGTFTLQAVVLEYATGRLIAEASGEIQQGVFARLIEHGIAQANAKDYVRQTQERLLVAPLLAAVERVYRERAVVEERLLTLLDQQRAWAKYAQGYVPANLLALLRELRGHLRLLNLSQLAIRGAYLQGAEMQDTVLSGATLQETVWTSAIDAIWSVAISACGQYWAAGSRWGEVRVWRKDGQLLHLAWQAHSSTVATLAFSPDERTLATGSFDGSVRLWDLEHGTLLWTSWQANNIQRLVFAPDGRMLASSGADAAVRLWDAKSGAHLWTLSGHRSPVYTLAWNPDGSVLASAGLDARILLWDLPGGKPASNVRMLQTHGDWVFSLAFTPDGRTLASAHWNGTVKLWDIANQRVRETVSGHSGQVWAVAWSPDGRTMAICEWDQTIWLWDIEQSTYRAVLHGHSAGVHGMAFTPDSRSLISGSDDGTLRVWDVESGQCVRVMQGYAVSLSDVAWSPDGSRLASAGSDLLVSIWDPTDRTARKVLRGHRWNVYGVGWSPDGRWLASSGWDNAVRVWDPATGSEVQVLRDPDHVDTSFYSLAWSPDGRFVASGSYQHGIQVWELSTGIRRWVGGVQPTRIRRVAWSPDGTWLASGGEDGNVRLWDVAEGGPRQQFDGHRGVVMSVVWSPDGTRLATGGSGRGGGGEIFVWEVASGKCLRAWSEPGAIVYALAWSPDASVLLSSSGDGSMRWWDLQRGACVTTRQGHQGAIQSLSVSPDGGMVASCGDDGAVNIWDIGSGERLLTLRGDRPYERLDITGVKGLTDAQKTTLHMLGAVERAPSSEFQQAP